MDRKHKHFNYKTKGEGVCMCFMSKGRRHRLNKYQQSASCWRRDIIKNKRRKGWSWCGRFLLFCCPSYVSVFRHHSSLTAQIKRGREALQRKWQVASLLVFLAKSWPHPTILHFKRMLALSPFLVLSPSFLNPPFRKKGEEKLHYYLLLSRLKSRRVRWNVDYNGHISGKAFYQRKRNVIFGVKSFWWIHCEKVPEKFTPLRILSRNGN